MFVITSLVCLLNLFQVFFGKACKVMKYFKHLTLKIDGWSIINPNEYAKHVDASIGAYLEC